MLELSKLSHFESRSISGENLTGEKGRGGMATETGPNHPARELGQGWKVSPTLKIPAGEVGTLADIDGSGIIKHIWITDTCPHDRRLIIRFYWDGSETPSVEVPLGDFFAAAEYQKCTHISSLAVCVNSRKALNCYWDMPFYKHCRVTLENLHNEDVEIFYQIDYVTGEVPPGRGYFHAQFRRTNPLKYGDVYTILDGVRGNGHYVGTYLFWGVNNNGWWGEGEAKFYIDGDGEFPTICGTGTEDYFCGAYCFDNDCNYEPYGTPYSGMRMNFTDDSYASCRRFSMYRWHITDPIYFKRDLRVTIQALGWRSEDRYLPLQDDISSVAYWYQDTVCEDFPPLPSRDELEII